MSPADRPRRPASLPDVIPRTWEVFGIAAEYEREKKPVGSLYTAMLLLAISGDNTVCEFHRWHPILGGDEELASIERTTCSGHYGATQSTQTILVTREVERALIPLTDGSPEWGYTDEMRRTASPRLWAKLREMSHEIDVAWAV